MDLTGQPSVYVSESSLAIRRLTELIDLRPGSSSFGCLDVERWRYLQGGHTDARMQEGAYALARASQLPAALRAGFPPELLRTASVAALRYRLKTQNDDGSFDEWYGGERSYCATAFGTLAALSTAECLHLSEPDTLELRNATARAIRFLSRTPDVPGNQLCAALAAAVLAQKFVNGAPSEHALAAIREAVRHAQHDEGWFDEYGGPDFGYLLLSIDLLMRAHEADRCAEWLDRARAAFTFWKQGVLPDGTYGGALSSRGTSLWIPSALTRIAAYEPDAARILRLWATSGVARNRLRLTSSLPDRQLARYAFGAIDAAIPVEAILAGPVAASLPRGVERQAHSLPRRDLEDGAIVVNLRQAGAWVAASAAGWRMCDGGLLIRCTDGSVAASGACVSDAEPQSEPGHEIVATAEIYETETHRPVEALRAALGGIAPVLAQFGLSQALKHRLRQRMILRRRSAGSLRRAIRVFPDRVEVTDEIRWHGRSVPDSISVHAGIEFGHSPSGDPAARAQAVETGEQAPPDLVAELIDSHRTVWRRVYRQR